jgi:thymidylate kinase
VSVIAIFGPDGSGKTTQIDLIEKALRDRQIKTHRTWICSHHLFTWMIYRIFVKFGFYEERPSRQCPLEKYPPRTLWANPIGRSIMAFTELLGIVLKILYDIHLHRLLGYTIIIERYIAGSLADLYYTLELPPTSLTSRILLALIDKHAILIRLDADYSNIKDRRRIQVEPVDYIETQRTIYKWFADHVECLNIDTTRVGIEETHAIIAAHVDQLLRVR